MDHAEVLRLEAVLKRYAGHVQPAVDQVSLTLKQGEILGLLGSSGCGKTTLLRMIAGFERPQQGKIFLNGGVVADADGWVVPERRDVGMVFQDYALFPHLTVAKNVAFGLVNRARGQRRFTPQQIHELTQAAIAQVGLQDLDQRYPHELSGGQQQRVALARALAPRPALILLDEPLSNLDVQVRLRLREEIRTVLKSTNTAAIFVTHDQEEALSLADWVAVMRHGRIEQLGRPETIYREPASRFVAEFVTQANFLPAVRNGAAWETEVGAFVGVVTLDSAVMAQADLMIRQEDLQLEPDETAGVIIRDRQFLGREHRYCLLTPSGQELHALSTHTPLPIGTRVRLSVPDMALRAFPRSTTARIREARSPLVNGSAQR